MSAAVSFDLVTDLDGPTTMPLPDVIPVRRTEEEAGYVSFRPVVRQNFRLHDLLGMVLAVTGRHPERIRQILRAGGVSFHSYRYSWTGFPVEEQELAALLASFPGDDPSRAFRPEACAAVLIEAGSPPRTLLELDRASASRKRLFQRRTLWDALLVAASSGTLAYAGYSYEWRADFYRLDLSAEQASALSAAAKSLASRDLRRNLQALERASHLVFVCPREAS